MLNIFMETVIFSGLFDELKVYKDFSFLTEIFVTF